MKTTPEETARSGNWFGSRRIVRTLLLAALLTLGILNFNNVCNFIGMLWRVATPLIVGAALAYGLDVIVGRLEKIYFPNAKNKWLIWSRRPLCTLAALVVIAFLLILIVSTVIPGFVDAFSVLAREVPRYIGQVKDWLLGITVDFPSVHDSIQSFQLNWDELQTRLINFAVSGWTGILSSTVTAIGAVTGSLTNILMSVIFAAFLLMGRGKLKEQWNRLTAAALPESKLHIVRHVCTVLHRTFSGFIVGQGLNALILGALTTVFMLLFGMPYAMIVGIVSGTTALLPIIGNYIGAAVGTFLVFTVNPGQAWGFLIFIVILQTVLGNLLYPRLLGSSVGLPSLWVLFAVVLGGGLGGIGGMLVGVPLMAAAYHLISEWVCSREKSAESPMPEPPSPPPGMRRKAKQ